MTMLKMEIVETILTRRSIRSFKKKTISKKIVDKLLECGLAAPSSKNSNPWYFLVLEGKDKNEVAEWMKEVANTGTNMPWNPRTNQPREELKDSTAGSAKAILEAGALIMIFNRAPFSYGFKEMEKKPKFLYTFTTEILGIGAAVENILLAAHGLGLGAFFISDIYPCKSKIKEKYRLDYDLIGAIAVGYPAYKLTPRKLKKEFAKFW